MIKTLLIAILLLPVMSLHAECRFPIKPLSQFDKNPLKETKSLLNSAKSGGRLLFSVLAYSRQGEPASRLVRFKSIDDDSLVFYLLSTIPNNRIASVTMLEQVGDSEVIQVRAVGPFSLKETRQEKITYASDNKRDEKPTFFNFLTLKPTWVKLGYYCILKEGKKLRRRKAMEVSYTKIAGKWQRHLEGHFEAHQDKDR